MTSWLDTLSNEARERVFAVMRALGAEADAAEAEHRRLAPRHGEMCAPPTAMDPFFRCEALRGVLAALRLGADPKEAKRAGKYEVQLAIRLWNNARAYQVRRWVQKEDATVERAVRRVVEAAGMTCGCSEETH